MYEFLRGQVTEKGPMRAVLDVGGIGYRLETSLRTSSRMPAVGQTAQLLAILKPQEDALRLFGFIDEDERQLFGTLTAISGIGPTHALALLSALNPHEVWSLADAGDAKALAKTKGIGPKLAQRVCIELAGRPARRSLTAADGPVAPAPEADDTPAGPFQDAVDALLVLGYNETQATSAVKRAAKKADADADVETLIRDALRGA